MRHLALLALFFPAVALAQPGPPPPPPGEPAPAPTADPAAPAPAPPPAPAPAPAPPPAGGYYQPVQPVYGPPPQPTSLHNGMTFEANLGLGWIRLSDNSGSETFGVGLAGLSLGVGGWVSPKLAITGRLAGVTYSENGGRLTNGFLGPSLQYWVDDHFWLGGGAGLGVVAVSNDNGGTDNSIGGISLDLRIGYTFSAGTENTFNASFELNPGWYSDDSGDGQATAIGILFGYQHL